MVNIEENSTKYLERLYDRLYDDYLLSLKNSKIKVTSIIFPFLHMNSNNALRLLSQSSLDSLSIPSAELNWLKTKNFIRETDEVNKYTITAQGIFSIEEKRAKVNTKSLIDFIDSKFFNLFSSLEATLDDKGKIIIFAMMAARVFSDKSPVDLKKSDKASEVWLEILTRSYELLKSINVIKEQPITKIFGEEGKKGNESAASYRFRRTGYLPKVTKRIFNAPGGQKYYLDLSDGKDLKTRDLQFLFKKIFEGSSLDSNRISKILDFFKEIAHTKDKYIFDIDKHIFTRFEYDSTIKDIIIKL